LPEGSSRLEIVTGAGHFPWLDDPEAYWEIVTSFVVEAAG
jgi:pimeloyl-ACP methyl ester carboxylesterase